jgi:hypothetical protein
MRALGKFALASFFVSGVIAAPQSTASDRAPFSLTVSVPHSSVKVGDEITVEITIQNISDHDIYHVRTVMGGDVVTQSSIKTSVRDSEGNPVAETPFGRRAHDTEPRTHPEGGSVFSDRTLLKPGDKTHEGRELSKEYDLSKPGKYTVQASQVDWKSGETVVSNVVTVDVSDQ